MRALTRSIRQLPYLQIESDRPEAQSVTQVGNSLNITVQRDGKRHDLKVVVGDMAQVFPESYGKDRSAPVHGEEATSLSIP